MFARGYRTAMIDRRGIARFMAPRRAAVGKVRGLRLIMNRKVLGGFFSGFFFCSSVTSLEVFQ